MVALGKFMKTSGLSALAAGIALVAVPAVALADPGDWQRGGGERRGGEQRGGGEQRAQPAPQAQMPQQAPRPQPEFRAPQPQPAPQMRGWNGGNPGGNPGREGWGGQRPDGQRRDGPNANRNWNNGGEAGRPAPAWRGQNATPGQNGWQQRNPAYSDPNRNRGYDSRPAPPVRPETWQRDGNGWHNSDRSRPQSGWNGQNNWDRRGDNQDNRRDNRRDTWQRDHNPGWNRDRAGGWERERGGDRWNRDWRRDDRYDWSGWRNQHREVFRMGRYDPPYRDWSYRRLSIGIYLQSGFFGSNYWIDDPWSYRLPPAYGPYRWVRYYDDALLVNIYDGEVVDVLYDFFW